jgi:ADP-heptose:LPS heptosyltransferase
MTAPALIFSNGLGDHLLSLPAARALAHLFPHRLALLCQPGAGLTFFHGLPLRAVVETPMAIEPRGKRFDAEAAARALGPTDLLLSLNPWHGPSVDRLLALLSPPRSIGFHPGFTEVLERDFSKHSAELAFDVPRRLAPRLALDDFAEPPDFPPSVHAAADAVWRSLPPAQRTLAVHADSDEARKMWPAAAFREVLDAVLERHPGMRAVVVGIEDLGLAAGRHGARVTLRLGLPVSVATLVVGRSDLFLGIDSCFLHAADLFRVPGVALFGPTAPHEWGFRFGPGRALVGSGGDLASIRPEVVAGALEALLAGAAPRTLRPAPRAAVLQAVATATPIGGLAP